MCKKFLFGIILTATVCLSACSNGNAEITETSGESGSAAVENSGVTATECADTDAEDIPYIADPYAAVNKYLQELSENKNVTSAELRETRIGQTSSIAYKYYENPLAEKFGVTPKTGLISAIVDYYIKYEEASGLQSGGKSEYFIVKSDESGFEVIDTFAYDPKDYYGEIKEVLTDKDFCDVHYLVELDGGLGTVECINAAMYGDFETGTRIYIEANGDIYGDAPRLDAIFMCGESEMSYD